MHQPVSTYIRELARSKALRRRVAYVLCLLSVVVAIAVVWQLKLTGITMTGEAFCGHVEHTHTDACVERVLVCGQEESAGHTHSVEAGCYTEEKTLTCGLEEHTHSVEAGCYDDDGNLVCELPEHTHTDDCYTTEYVLTCTQPESAGHTHTDACYETRYVCGLEEHVHTLACYSNSQADLETSDAWEQSIPTLTGKSADDLVSVAVSQLGVSESSQNFQLADDGTTKRGYSRYGAWYGNPYGQWGAMFASFCLSYAGNPQYSALANSGAQTMLVNAQQAGLYRSAGEGYSPQAGDLAYIDADYDGQADNVAIVEWVDTDTTGDVHVVQGDSNFDAVSDRADAVERAKYAASDPRILGYAQLPHYTNGVLDSAEPDSPAGDEDSSADANDCGATGEPGEDAADDNAQADEAIDDDESAKSNDVAANTVQVDADSESGTSEPSIQETQTTTLDIIVYINDGSGYPVASNKNFQSADGVVYLKENGGQSNPSFTFYKISGVTQRSADSASVASYWCVKLSDLKSKLEAHDIDTACLNAATSSSRYFASMRWGSNIVTANADMVAVGGEWYVPVTSFSGINNALFYLPASGATLESFDQAFGATNGNLPTDATKFEKSVSKGFSSKILGGSGTDDRFYTIGAPGDSIGSSDKYDIEIVQRGSNPTVTVPECTTVGGYWACYNTSGAAITDTSICNKNADGTEFSFTNITQPYNIGIAYSNALTITYDMNIESGYSASKTEGPSSFPTVTHLEVSEGIASDGTATFEPQIPDYIRYVREKSKDSGDKFKERMVFKGWEIYAGKEKVGEYSYSEESNNSSSEITLTAEQVNTRSITLKAIWEPEKQTVRFWVFQDGEPVQIDTQVLDWTYVAKANNDNDKRMTIAASDLLRVYENKGYQVDSSAMVEGSYFFGNGIPSIYTGADSNIWFNVPAWSVNGEVRIPLYQDKQLHRNVVDVYYMPGSGAVGSSEFETAYGTRNNGYSVESLVADMAQNPVDNFWTVTVTTKNVDGTAETKTPYLNGTKVTVDSLPGVPEDWMCVGRDGTVIAGTQSGDSMVTFVIDKINQPYFILPSGEAGSCTVEYDLNLPHTADNAPTLEKTTDTVDLSKTTNYTMLAPSALSYYYKAKDSDTTYKQVTFVSWEMTVDGDSSTKQSVAAGSTIGLYQYAGKTIKLTAKWSNPEEARMVYFHAFVDGKDKELGSAVLPWYTIGNRFYLKASDVVPFYQENGFNDIPELRENQLYFVCTKHEVKDKIWINAESKVNNGEVFISPLLTTADHASSCNVYLIPNSGGSAADFNTTYGTGQSFDVDTILSKQNDVFYSVTVKGLAADPDNGKVAYYPYGKSASFTFTCEKASEWICRGADGTTINGTKSSDGTSMTFEISNVSQSYEITRKVSEGKILVKYDLNLQGTYDAESAPSVGLVSNMEEFDLSTSEDSLYTVKGLSPDAYDYTLDNDNRTHRAIFKGWSLKASGATAADTSKLYADGGKIDLSEYVTKGDKEVTLVAQWTTADYGTVHCYAFIDGALTLVKDIDVPWIWKDDNKRYYMSYEYLDDVYGTLGFNTGKFMGSEDSSEAHKSRYFAISTPAGDVWADADNVYDNGWLMPLYCQEDKKRGRTEINVYYLPVTGASSDDSDEHGAQTNGLSHFDAAFGAKDGHSSTSGAKGVSRDTFSQNGKSENSLYTVTVYDPTGEVIQNPSVNPEVRYVLAGSTGTVTLAKHKNYNWVCYGADGTQITGSDDADDNVVFTIPSIAQSYTIVLSRDDTKTFHIHYDLNLVGEFDSDGAPRVGNSTPTHDVYLDVPSSGDALSYTALEPSTLSYIYNDAGSGTKHLNMATFKGWKVSYEPDNGGQESSGVDAAGTTTDTTGLVATDGLLQSGQTLTLDKSKAEFRIVLTAVWEYSKTGELSDSTVSRDNDLVNFYISTNVRSEDVSDWEADTDAKYFTDSVWLSHCGVKASEIATGEKYDPSTDADQYQGLWYDNLNGAKDQYRVYGLVGGKEFKATDAAMRQTLEVNGLTRYSKLQTDSDGNRTPRTYQITFPTDEYVLKQVRAQVSSGKKTITINGTPVTADQLTTTNFGVCWYVFKMHQSDGWHIDGVLVAKTSTLTVTKTFAGEDDPINAVKANYFITVEPASGTTTGEYNTTRTLVLSEADGSDAATSRDATLHPTSISDDGRIYTWKVPVDQYYKYTVEENNYTYTPAEGDTSGWASNISYSVSNARNESENTSGFAKYPEGGATVTGADLTDGNTQGLTVAFRNTYVASGTVLIQKIDSESKGAIAGVQFALYKRENGTDTHVPVYPVNHPSGQHHYTLDSTKSTTSAGDDTTTEQSNTVVTDDNGQIFLENTPASTYVLKETTPDGYDDIPGKEILLEVVSGTTDGQVAIKSASVPGLTDEQSASYIDVPEGASIPTLTVTNYSKRISLTVDKKWTAPENTLVKIQLYCNDVPVPNGLVELGTQNGEGERVWSKTWNNLPLCLDGKLANYSVREVAIGDYAYSEAISGGYQYYTYDVSKPEYSLDGQTLSSDKALQADSVRLIVTNTHLVGGLTFKKADNLAGPIEGAVFKLWQVTKKDDTTNKSLDIGLDDLQIEKTEEKDGDGNVVSTGYGLSLKNTSTTNDKKVKIVRTSQSDGSVAFGDVPAGIYYMLEYSAPEGYICTPTVYKVEIINQENYSFFTWDESSASWVKFDFSKTVTNQLAYASLDVRKTSDYSDPLAGAQFELYKKNASGGADKVSFVYDETLKKYRPAVEGDTADSATTTLTTGDNGIVSLAKLEVGSYYLAETAAPAGYYRLNDRIYFSVAKGGIIMLDADGSASDEVKIVRQWHLSDADRGVYTLTVVDHTGEELPSTGGFGTAPFVVGGLVVMIGCILVAFHRLFRRGSDVK